ncbi:hypothetical protein JHK87_041891 [Glycine soja]|nr:hypothetical protein JHK87_041891 [Glycine soja]
MAQRITARLHLLANRPRYLVPAAIRGSYASVGDFKESEAFKDSYTAEKEEKSDVSIIGQPKE